MGNIKILLVEDEAIIALHLSMELELGNYEVGGFVSSGEEAIKKAKTENPDLILMDILLSGEMDGIEAAEKIKEKQEVQIIFMTGYSRQDYIERAAKLNPLGYFHKPVEMNVINPVIRKYFGSK